MSCGHDIPSKEETSYLAKSPFPFEEYYQLTLFETNAAKIEIGGKVMNGKWTMIYDEGFNIEFGELNFFAFSKYSPAKSTEDGHNYHSYCYSTCVGWYHNKDKTQWGCYQATKEGVNPDEITYLDTKNNLNIVDPYSTPGSDTSIVNSFLNMNFRERKSEIIFGDDVQYQSNKKSGSKFLKKNSSFIAVAERESMMLRLDSTFKAHNLYLNRLKNVKKSWTAELHPEFSNLSIGELNKFAGITRSRVSDKTILKQAFQEDVSMFPKQFDWKHATKAAGTQGNCGSCYAYSTIKMTEARLNILFNHDVNLSIQHPLDCSFYTQGCNGGYPYLIMKFANEFGLLPDTCKPYAVSMIIIII